MEYILSRTLEKQFSKLPRGVKTKAIAAFERFVRNPADTRLRAHSLTGKWHGYSSIDVIGDYRAIYVQADPQVVRFVAIGTHGELYG